MADIYNQAHPEETPELITKGQAALHDEISKLSPDKKRGWLQAKEKCPDLVDDAHTLMFLRCEVFNADLAAIRLAKYWSKRIEIFGTNAFQPITISSPIGPDIEKGLTIQFMRLTQTKDTGNRALIYAEASRLMGAYDKSKDEDRMRIAQAVWYLFHVALEDEVVQKNGMVFIVNYLGAQLSMVDPKLMKLVMPSVSGCLPVRVGAIHVCNPPGFFEKVVYPIIKLFMSERMRSRINLHHNTSDPNFLSTLGEKYGLDRGVLPTELGGYIALNGLGWIEERKIIEFDNNNAIEEDA